MNNKYKVMLMGLLLSVTACDTSLNVPPKAALSEEQVTTTENLDALVTATYSYLGNDHYTAPMFLWPTGNLRAGDAHKGGNGPNDIFAYHALSLYGPIIADGESMPPDFIDLNNKKWVRNFTGISRANTALRVISQVDEADYPQKNARMGEVRMLRGIFYFDLKIHYKRIPYVTENMTSEEIRALSNMDLSDQELWDAIADDFRFAMENLPETQAQIGRGNRYSATAYLAKTLLYQAYEQNDQHEVINIDTDKLEEVVALIEEIEASDNYGLMNDYAQNFLWAFDNNQESVFAIQRSMDDGSPDGRGSWPTALNAPMQGGFGCCGFHVPTENFVNAFKTDANGLPLFDTFNNANYNAQVDAVDPRLDHTVGMQGKPFKYDDNLIVDNADAWARAPGVYGNFISMKELEHPDCDCRMQNGPFPIFSKNTVLIRYADVLLWKAEALIELEREDEALPIINEIRARAANSTARLGNFSIYNMGTYAAFADQDEARRALQWERRLELGLEGHRFFDLVRWGIAKETLDEYLAVEETRKPYLTAANFQAGKHEYMPIPQQQINLSGGLYQQLPGY
jgi:starch-binding outer membrane protein, SusD/RagB family